MSDDTLQFEFIGRKPATRGVAEREPQIVGTEDLRKILLSADQLRGARGFDGPQGRRGRRGIKGETGPRGHNGIDGRIGIDGRQGEVGPRGVKGDKGDKGDVGAQGAPGPAPRHKWEGTRLSFEQPDGTFGRAVNLQGPGGAGGGGRSAKETWQSIQLVGTDLIFTKNTAGPLGKSTTVDLSSIAGGSGGFAGLGPWRYRTEITTPPASGQVRFNNADPESATELYLSETNDDAEDLANFIALLDAGDVLYLQQKDNADNFIVVEISSNTDNGTDVTLGIANIAQQGAALTQNTEMNLVASIAGGGAGSVVTGLTTAADGDDITLTQTAGGNQVADTSDFLWKLGKAGGQTARGGTLAGQTLTLQGSAHANRGRNIIAGGATIDWDWTSDAITTGGLNFANTIPASGGLISSLITAGNVVGVNSGLFIMSAFDDFSQLTWSTPPTFAVTTLFFARQNYRSSTAGVAPAQAFTLASQCQYWLTGAGDVTSPTYRAISFAPIIRTDNSGDRMRLGSTNGVTVNPLYNTRNANSTADFGDIRGVHMINAGTILFGQALGGEIATSWIGVDCEALTGLTVSGRKAAVRSAIPNATNARFIENLSSANSDFNTGNAFWRDNAGPAFGGAYNSADVLLSWQAAGYLRFFFTANNDDLRLSNPANGRFLLTSNTPASDNLNIDVGKVAFLQSGAIGNQKVVFATKAETITIGGEFAQYLLTQSANDTINAALGLYAGWSLNAPTPVIGTGSLTTNVGLNVAGNPGVASVNRVGLRILSNPSGGSGINAALWVTAGRSQFDGIVTLPRNTNANRGAAGEAGRIIFNTDDGQLNVDDGTNWTLPDGTVT